MSSSRGPPGGSRLRSILTGGDRGVSEVVGAAILIGIAVVLATVIASFVFGLSPGGEQKPDSAVDITRQPDITTKWDPVGEYRVNVVQIRARHGGGEDINRDSLSVRITARSANTTANGYLLHYNHTGRVNKTEPQWNRISDATIEAGDLTDYELFATNSLGENDGVVAAGADPEDIWQRGECHVEEFGHNRDGGGSINISDGVQPFRPKSNASADCPFSGGNATILGGDIAEGGRIAEGDTIRIVWSPPGASKSHVLKEDDVEEV